MLVSLQPLFVELGSLEHAQYLLILPPRNSSVFGQLANVPFQLVFMFYFTWVFWIIVFSTDFTCYWLAKALGLPFSSYEAKSWALFRIVHSGSGGLDPLPSTLVIYAFSDDFLMLASTLCVTGPMFVTFLKVLLLWFKPFLGSSSRFSIQMV